jgi:hypothetical protein
MFFLMCKLKSSLELGMVAHACNLSYWGGGEIAVPNQPILTSNKM